METPNNNLASVNNLYHSVNRYDIKFGVLSEGGILNVRCHRPFILGNPIYVKDPTKRHEACVIFDVYIAHVYKHGVKKLIPPDLLNIPELSQIPAKDKYLLYMEIVDYCKKLYDKRKDEFIISKTLDKLKAIYDKGTNVNLWCYCAPKECHTLSLQCFIINGYFLQQLKHDLEKNYVL